MALLFNPILLADDALKVFKSLSKNVRSTVKHGYEVDKNAFAQSIRVVGDSFEYQGQKHIMNYKGAQLAEKLVYNQQLDLASIIYGVLIKNNEHNPVLLEEFAKRGLALARKTNDPIHIMARLDDLNHLYRKTEYGSKKHFKILSEEKNVLLEIVKHYDKAVQRYNTISRPPLTKNHYEFMLCGIRMEIAKIIMEKNPFIAITELEAAQNLMRKYGNGTLTKRIEMLLDQAYSYL